MRKFLIRWWYTPNWQADTYARMIRHWNDDWIQVPDVYTIHDPHRIRAEFCNGLLIHEDTLYEPYYAIKRSFDAEIKRIVPSRDDQ